MFEWLLKNKKLEPSSNVVIKHREDESRLIIKKLEIEHIGTVRCVASNEVGQDSQSVELLFNGGHNLRVSNGDHSNGKTLPNVSILKRSFGIAKLARLRSQITGH